MIILYAYDFNAIIFKKSEKGNDKLWNIQKES